MNERERLQQLAGPEFEDELEKEFEDEFEDELEEPIDDERNPDAWDGGFAENH